MPHTPHTPHTPGNAGGNSGPPSVAATPQDTSSGNVNTSSNNVSTTNVADASDYMSAELSLDPSVIIDSEAAQALNNVSLNY